MLASQLASRIRKLHDVPFGGAEVFHHSSCNDMANLIRERRGEEQTDGASSKQDKASLAASSLFSKNIDLTGVKLDPTRIDGSSSCGATMFQLIPMFVIYPIW